MAPFVPPEPPIEPDAPVDPPALQVPLSPPEVGFGSPWAPADAENRDRILDWWRAWWRSVFFPWIARWITYWHDQWVRIVNYLKEWLTYAGEYIEEHAIAGYSFRVTDDPIATTGDSTVTITVGEDTDHRPLVIGDLVVDQTEASNFGWIVAVIDDTTAVVNYLGTFKGYAGHGWWTTVTPITHAGTTPVVIAADPNRLPQIGDLVVDTTSSAAWGIVTIVTDSTHVTVSYLGTLQGPQGIQGEPGEQGEPGPPGADGVVTSIVAGANITVDSTDPAHPIVSATGGGGGGVTSIVAGKGFSIDATDPDNPVINVTAATGFPIPVLGSLPGSPGAGDLLYYAPLSQFLWYNGSGWKRLGIVQTIVAGAHITVDNTDPNNPIVAVSTSGFVLDPIDPNLEIVNEIDRFGIGTVVGVPGVDHFGVLVYDDHTNVYGEDTVNIGSEGFVKIGSSHSVAVAGEIEVHADLNGIRMTFNDGSGATLRALVIIDQKGMRMDTAGGQSGYFGLPPHTDETTTPSPGFMYYNSATGTVRVFNGSGWFDLDMTAV